MCSSSSLARGIVLQRIELDGLVLHPVNSNATQTFAREHFGYEMTVLGTKPDFRSIFKKTLEMESASPHYRGNRGVLVWFVTLFRFALACAFLRGVALVLRRLALEIVALNS